MKLLIALNHPAHYYLFKFIRKELLNRGHEVKIVIREKDVLKTLLSLDKVDYHILLVKKSRRNNALSVIYRSFLELIIQDIALFRFVKRYKPQLMMGTDIAITHVGRLIKVPSIVFNEDDYEINKLFCKMSYPFASSIVAPEYTSVGKYVSKKIAYNGIQKMAYLNPYYYKPDRSVLYDAGLKETDKYFIIRLVSLTAGHDIEGKHKGISNTILHRIINKLKDNGRVFITSEDNLPKELERYQISVPKNKMHDFMSFASLFIGDSQTMCAEAGILGTPFIRFNDFVGKIKYLDDLENNYGLGVGIKTNDEDKLFAEIEKYLEMEDIKKQWDVKRKKLFNDKVDLTKFSVELIEKYEQAT